jgi:hypothetical protein
VSGRLPEVCRDGELVDENCNNVVDEDVVVGKLAEAFAVTNETDVRVDARTDGPARALVSIAVTPPAATLVIGSKEEVDYVTSMVGKG